MHCKLTQGSFMYPHTKSHRLSVQQGLAATALLCHNAGLGSPTAYTLLVSADTRLLSTKAQELHQSIKDCTACASSLLAGSLCECTKKTWCAKSAAVFVSRPNLATSPAYHPSTARHTPDIQCYLHAPGLTHPEEQSQSVW